jgi:DNA-binding transcriptional regulator YiaG
MYHYTESGLRSVWLANGYEERRTRYGKAVAIRDIEGLHRVICRRLIATRPRLSGAEFRFIRKELDLSQAGLARILGNDPQSIALWERKGRVPMWADRFVRALYREHAEGNAQIRALVRRLSRLEEAGSERITFERTGRGWKAQAA